MNQSEQPDSQYSLLCLSQIQNTFHTFVIKRHSEANERLCCKVKVNIYEK